MRGTLRTPFIVSVLMLVACQPATIDPPGWGDTEGVRWPDGAPDFSPARNVLLIPLNKTESGLAKDFNDADNCFYDNAVLLKRFYEGRGAKATVLSINLPDVLMTALDKLADKHQVFDRIIFISHGGWDGPMFYHSWQIGSDWPQIELKEREGPEHKKYYLQIAFLQYGVKLNRVLSRAGWLWLGGCNSATEGNSVMGAKRYTDAIACATDRMAYGTMGPTACWDVRDRVQKLENGIKTPSLWRSNPKNIPSEMVCFGDPMPSYPPLLPPPDLMPPPGLDAGPSADGSIPDLNPTSSYP